MTAALLALGLVAPAGDPPRELIHFGPAGPTRVRLRAVVRGAEVDSAWAAAAGRLFTLLDRDGNGTLDKAEQAAVTTPIRRPRTAVVTPDQMATNPLRLEFPGEGPVDLARFTAALKAAGLGPVTFTVTPPRADAAAVSAALFKHLDADGDGRLSAAELAAARDRLAPLDADEDECLTPAELLDRPPVPGAATAVAVRPAMVETTDKAADLLLLDPVGGPAVKQVLAARGPARATALKRAEFGADEKPFAALDADGNGRLDSTELAAWLGRPPEAEATLDLTAGRATGDAAVSRPGLRVRFDPPAARPDAWAAAVNQLRDEAAGLLKAGPLDRKAATPPVAALFDLADRNADGKLDAAEVEAAVAVLAGLGDARLGLAVADHGTGLFELLDADGDGRLSPRELLGAAAAVRPFADAAGTVGPADLPRRLVVTATAQPLAVVLPAPPPAARVAAGPDLPAWFVGMDRNRDGDVSRREFVGPDAAFRRLDADGDGLISPAEARAAGR